MEFSHRALGNRSILADPRNPKMKNILNQAIKFREGFRPFAPSVLEEEAYKIFNLKKDERIYFMEKVAQVKPRWRKKKGNSFVYGYSRVYIYVWKNETRGCCFNA